MANIKIDGVEYEVTEQVAQVVEVQQKRTDSKMNEMQNTIAELSSSNDKAQARIDALESEKERIEKERNDALDPVKIQSAINARLDLERKSKEILGEEIKLDGLNDSEIKIQVIKKSCPNADLENKSSDYIDARFDAALELENQSSVADANKSIIETRAAVTKQQIKNTSASVESVRNDALNKIAGAHKESLAFTRN